MIGATFVRIHPADNSEFLPESHVITPCAALVADSQRIAQGDLTLEIDTRRQDEVGKVMQAMQQMVEKLRHIIGEVLIAADKISAASEHLSTTSSQVSRATEQQAHATSHHRQHLNRSLSASMRFRHWPRIPKQKVQS